MERKSMSKDNKLSLIIIGIFFLFLLLMGTSSCSRSGGVASDRMIFNKGKAAAHKQYEGLRCYLVSFNSVVDGKEQSGSKVVLAYNDGLALSHYRSQVVEMLGFSKIESLSFDCNEFEYEALLGPDVAFKPEYK